MIVRPRRLALSAALVATGLGVVVGALLLAGATPQFREGLGGLGVLRFFVVFALVGIVHGVLAAFGAGAALLLRRKARGMAVGAAVTSLLAWLVVGAVAGGSWLPFAAGVGALVAVLSGIVTLVLLESDARRSPAVSEVRMPS